MKCKQKLRIVQLHSPVNHTHFPLMPECVSLSQIPVTGAQIHTLDEQTPFSLAGKRCQIQDKKTGPSNTSEVQALSQTKDLETERDRKPAHPRTINKQYRWTCLFHETFVTTGTADTIFSEEPSPKHINESCLQSEKKWDIKE